MIEAEVNDTKNRPVDEGDKPGDKYHSKDEDNLMHPGSGGEDKVDCQWCQKIINLAR